MDFSSVEGYEAWLGSSIRTALKSDVSDDVKTLIQTAQEKEVYSYHKETLDPIRRRTSGGFQDKKNMEVDITVEGLGSADSLDYTMNIAMTAPWTRESDHTKAGMDLSEAIEIGKLQGKAGPRPFIGEAEELVQNNALRLEKKIKHFLVSQGL